MTDEERQQELEKVNEAIAKFEGQKRWSDVVRNMMKKIDLIEDEVAKMELLEQGAQIYLEKSNNKAEAIKCFERLLEMDPAREDVMQQLRSLYEERRDWQGVITMLQKMADDGGDKLALYREAATLASERVRKPDICIGLWEKVLEEDESDPDALEQLANLYDRAKEWPKLASVLERVLDANPDPKRLQKLGQVYSDKLEDDEGAVRTFKRLLEIDPNDRRAQEGLKKRLVARKAWDELEEFYAQTEKWDDVIRIFERAAGEEGIDAAESQDLFFRAARLYQEQKGQPDRAARVYEKVLDRDPTNLAAADALIPIYEAAEDGRKLVKVYEVRLQGELDDFERAELVEKTAQLYEEKLRAPDKAMLKWMDAYGRAPQEQVFADHVMRLAEQTKKWELLIEPHEAALERGPDGDAVVILQASLGNAAMRAQQAERAIKAYRAVIDVMPDHEEAVRALGELFRQTGDFASLLDVFEKRISLEDDQEVRKALSYERAALFVDELGDSERAVAAYRDILSEFGDGELAAHRALEGLLEKAESWQELAAHLENYTMIAEEPDDIAAARFRWGRLLADKLEDKARACALFGEVLETVPQHEGAIAALESMLQDDATAARAATTLEPVFEAAHEHEKLVRVLHVRHAHSEDQQEQLDILRRVAEVERSAGADPKQVFSSYAEAFRLAPDDEALMQQVEQMASAAEAEKDWVALLHDVASKSDDPELRRVLWMRAGTISQQSLGDNAGAIGAFQRVVADHPDAVDALTALEMLYREGSDPASLASVLRSRADAESDPDAKERFLLEVAEIKVGQLSLSEDAITVYREIIEFNPMSTEALEALDRIFENENRWSDLADNLDRQLELAESDDRRVGLMLRSAELRRTHMGAGEAAVEIYRDILTEHPGHPQAVAALESLLNDDSHKLAAAQLLENYYRDANETEKLVFTLRTQVDHAENPERKIELLHQMGELYEVSLDQSEGAFSVYAEALALDPHHPESLEQLERVNRALQNGQALAGVYETLAEKSDDQSAQFQLWMRAGAVRYEQLNDAEQAVALYKKAHALDEEHAEPISALEQIYRATEQHDALAQILISKAASEPDPFEQKQHLLQAASIYGDVLGRNDDAVGVYERVLSIDPEEQRALNSLIEIHVRAENYSALESAYARKAEATPDFEEKKQLYVQLGALLERELNKPEDAIAAYSRILEIDPDDMVALSRLDALYEQTENWQELLSTLERQAEIASDVHESVAHRYRVAELRRKQLGEHDAAVEIYRNVLDAMPDHGPARKALEEMVEAKQEPFAAARILEPYYEQTANWPRLNQILAVQVEHDPDPINKVENLHRMGELREVHLEDAKSAFEAYAQALTFDPRNDVTRKSVERLAEETQSWAFLAQRYDEETTRLKEEDPDDAAEMAFAAARIYEASINDAEKAIERYGYVTEVDPAHPSAVGALDRLYTQTERWPELAGVLEQELSLTNDPEEILSHHFRLGEVNRRHLNNHEAAITAYQEVLASDPGHEPSVYALEQMFDAGVDRENIGGTLEPYYQSTQLWGKFLDLREAQLVAVSDSVDRVGSMHRMAETAEMQANDERRAFVLMQRAVLTDPSHEHSLAETERLATMLDAWPEVATTYADALVKEDLAPEDKAILGQRLVRVYAEELDDVARAEETLRFLLSGPGPHREALDTLDELYTEYGAWQSLADILRRKVSECEDDYEKIELSMRLGHVLEADLGQGDDAIEVYESIVTNMEPEHEGALEALQNIYVRRGDWPSLFKVMKRWSEVTRSEDDRASILAKMAWLSNDYLNDPSGAATLWKQVTELRGEDPEALNAVGNIYAQQENWAELVEILEREAQVTDDPRVRQAIYTDLAEIWYGKLRRDRNAIEAWERVLDLDQANTHALLQMAEIHRATQQSSELVDTLLRVIEVGSETLPAETLEAVHVQLARLYVGEMEQSIDAAEHYRKALAVNPQNLEVVDELEALYRKEEDWENVVDAMAMRADALPETADKVEQLFATATAWREKLENPEGGIGALERIIELEPLNKDAFKKLDKLYRKTGQWEELVDLCVTRVENSDEVEVRVAMLCEAAKIYEENLDSKADAFEALQIAWTEDFGDKDVVQALERMAGLTNRWGELLTSANQLLMEEIPQEDRIAIHLSCAKWYATLGQFDHAITNYGQILGLDPRNARALWQLAELYESTGQHEKQEEQLSKLVNLTEDRDIKAETYVQLGDLNAGHLSQPEQARRYYALAVEMSPSNVKALEALENVHRTDENWDDLLSVLKRKVDAVKTLEDKMVAEMQVARVYADHLDDKNEAIARYTHVREMDGENLDALRGLETLLAETERWSELLEVLEKQYDLADSERERVELHIQIAALLEERFVKYGPAADRLERALEIDPVCEPALVGLTRLYRQLRDWQKLIETHERHAAIVADKEARVVVLKQLGDVYATEVGDVDRAVDTYLSVLDLDDDDIEAADELSKLYGRRGEHADALEMMDKVSLLTDDPALKVDLRFRIGQTMEKELQDPIGALEHYQRAVDLNAGHLPSLEALERVSMQEGDWLAAAKWVEQAASYAESPRAVAEMLARLGEVQLDKLDDQEKAVQAFESAIKEDSDNERAALPLSRIYIEAERFEEAEPHLDMLFKRSEKREPDEQRLIAMLFGETASKLEHFDLAVKAFERAHKLDTGDIEALTGLASAYFAAKDWAAAFKYYQMLLVHHRDSLGRDEVSNVFYRLGVIKREQGEMRKAINMFDKALEEDGLHRESLDAMVGVYEGQSDWEQVIHFKKRITEIAEDEERFKLLHEIGDLWSDKVGNTQRAIVAFEEARDIKSEDHVTLHKLLALFQKSGQWDQAIDLIDAISALDEREKAKAQYAYTVGVIYRDELKDPEASLERFNQALDIDPSHLKAFEAINKVLTQKKDWKNLERAYRKMLHRTVKSTDENLKFTLWQQLGLIYRDRLKDQDAAAAAFEEASKLRPHDTTIHQMRAEIYATSPERIDDAIKEHQWMLQNNPMDAGAYRTLYKLYFDARQYDKAWCLASTLAYLQKADPEQQQFYQQYKQPGMIRPRNRIDPTMWFNDMFHSEQDKHVSKILELAVEGVYGAKRASDKALNISKLKPVDLETSKVVFAQTYKFVAQVFDLPHIPRLYLQQQTPGGLMHLAGSAPPAVIAGATLLSGYQPQDLAFATGRFLTYYKPWHFIRTLMSTHGEIGHILLAALRIGGQGAPNPQVDQTAATMSASMQPNTVAGLRKAARLFVDAGGNANIKRWMQAVELTAIRAGFLMCGDLDISSRIVRALPPEFAADLPLDEKLKALVIFSVSEEYFRLREALGVQIQV